jgi:hypothetical protein
MKISKARLQEIIQEEVKNSREQSKQKLNEASEGLRKLIIDALKAYGNDTRALFAHFVTHVATQTSERHAEHYLRSFMKAKNLNEELEDVPPPTPIDTEAVRELLLYIENDGELYRQRWEPIVKNLTRKKMKGIYDEKKAAKLMLYLVNDGARKYVREFGGDVPWNKAFPMPVRKMVAVELVENFENYYEQEVK